MKLNERIKELYGSVDKMIKAAEPNISRTYLYQIIRGEYTNVTLDVAKELVKLLQLNSIEELITLLDDSEEV